MVAFFYRGVQVRGFFERFVFGCLLASREHLGFLIWGKLVRVCYVAMWMIVRKVLVKLYNTL